MDIADLGFGFSGYTPGKWGIYFSVGPEVFEDDDAYGFVGPAPGAGGSLEGSIRGSLARMMDAGRMYGMSALHQRAMETIESQDRLMRMAGVSGYVGSKVAELYGLAGASGIEGAAARIAAGALGNAGALAQLAQSDFMNPGTAMANALRDFQEQSVPAIAMADNFYRMTDHIGALQSAAELAMEFAEDGEAGDDEQDGDDE